MKKFAIISMSLFLIISFVIVVYASEKSVYSKTRQITGNVTAIDRKSNTVTVEKKNKKVILIVHGKSKIIQCTRKTAITDIKIGDKVTAKYTETTDKNTAKSITIRETVKKSD